MLFEIPPTEVAFFAKLTRKVQVGIGVNKSTLYSMMCFDDAGTGLNLTKKDYPRPHWKCRIKLLDAPRLWTATKESIKVQGFISVIGKKRTL